MRECPTCRNCYPDDVTDCPDDGVATTHSISGEPILDGRYQLEKRLGQGGMGIVFKGRHIFLKTLHAIKVILPDLVGNDPNLATRFRQEALAAAAIRHQTFIAAQTTGLMGSPFYMAPEQWSDEPPDARADIYSLGVMLFQMLSGEVPFKGSSIPSIMKKHLTQDVPSLASKGVDVPPQIEAVILHAMAKEPKRRTASADQFVDELRAAMAAASATLKRTGETAEIDPGKTIVSASPPAQVTFTAKGSTTAFDPMAGTISAASLEQEQQKTLFAQRELAREAEAKRKLAQEEDEKRKAEGQERDAERKHLEELVAQQTKVLEEKLTQLASTMAPKTIAATGSESAQFHRSGVATVGESSFPAISNVGLVPQKKSRLPLVLGLCVLLLIAGGVGGFFIFRPHAAIKPSGPNTPRGPEAPIKVQLIDIPGGTFQMGRNDGPPTEVPAHAVTVAGFAMDKTEVTNAEYAQFIREANHAPPEQWGSIKAPVGEELLPVSNISYDDAVAFAAWRSKRDGVTYRLPTEEEWEYAARNGDKNNLYPWGNTWQSGRAATAESGVGASQPVGTYAQGMNAWGGLDLVGNVWEWTSSKASLYARTGDDRLAQQKDWIVIRGGGYASSAKGAFPPGPVSSTIRNWEPPNYKNPYLGFRLVKSSS